MADVALKQQVVGGAGRIEGQLERALARDGVGGNIVPVAAVARNRGADRAPAPGSAERERTRLCR